MQVKHSWVSGQARAFIMLKNCDQTYMMKYDEMMKHDEISDEICALLSFFCRWLDGMEWPFGETGYLLVNWYRKSR